MHIIPCFINFYFLYMVRAIRFIAYTECLFLITPAPIFELHIVGRGYREMFYFALVNLSAEGFLTREEEGEIG